MYAADSAFTHALSREHGAAARAAPRRGRRRSPCCRRSTAPGWPTLSAAHVGDLTAADGWHGPDVALVLAAHGTLLAPEKPIDTGLAATEALRAGHRRAPAGALRPRSSTAGSITPAADGGPSRRSRPPWPRSRRRASARIVYYPYGFLADNAESELEGRIALAAHPAITARHLPCLNDSASLLAAIADQVHETAKIGEPVDLVIG